MKNKTILQVAHITQTPGPVQFLADYLKDKTADFYQIYHPLNSKKNAKSSFSKNYAVVEEKKISGYATHFFQTISWLKKIKKPIDLAVGMNCFDVLPLVIMKKKCRIKKVIFFNTDFSRCRFDNFFLSRIYIWLDKFCAWKADKICCNTKRTILKRIKESADNQKVVYTPNGVFLDKIGAVGTANKHFSKKILYVGDLSKEHGLGEVISVLAGYELKLEIIGAGDCEKELREIIKEKHLFGKVEFLGFKKHDEVVEYLKNFSGFGIAPYRLKSDWTYYCDPVKVKEYLACLVPVIISDVPEIAEEIASESLGFVFKDQAELKDIFERISKMGNEEYNKYLKNVEKIRKNFDLNEIYKKIF